MTVAAPARLFSECNMDAEALLDVAGGQAAVYSARGPDKESPNEDGAAVLPVDARAAALVVADGLGGQPGGQNATDLALRALRDALGGAGRETLRHAILDGIESANRAILELGIGAATTLAAVEIADGWLRPYHVGDSAILVVGQRGKLKLQTVSHSPVGYAVESGLLDEHEAMQHAERHLVSNLVGAPDMRIEVGSPLRLARRDTVLLATDGLLDNLALGEIVELIRRGPLAQAARALASVGGGRMRSPAPGEPSKPDDLTFVLFRSG